MSSRLRRYKGNWHAHQGCKARTRRWQMTTVVASTFALTALWRRQEIGEFVERDLVPHGLPDLMDLYIQPALLVYRRARGYEQ